MHVKRKIMCSSATSAILAALLFAAALPFFACCIPLQFIVACIVHHKLRKHTAQLPPSPNITSIQPALVNAAENNTKMVRSLSVFEKVKRDPMNPFVNLSLPIDALERLRLSFCAVTLFPFRLLMLAISLVYCYFWACIATFGLSKYELQQPFSPWRRRVVNIMRGGIRAFVFFLGYHWLKINGKTSDSKKAPIIVSNHLSFVESFVYLSQLDCSPVGAIEHLQIPLFGKIIAAVQCITVDRKSPSSRNDVMETIKMRSLTRRGEFPQILLFPEATCTNGHAMITFKSGGFIPGVPIQPCVARLRTRNFEPSWVWGGPELGMIFFRMLCEWMNHLEIRYLPVYQPDLQEQSDAVLYARNVRDRMCDALSIDSTEHSYHDVLLQQDACRKYRLPPESAVVGMNKIQKVLNVSIDTMKEQLETFAKLDKDGDGKLNLEEFFDAFDVEHRSPEIENLFYLLDEDESGQIDFREYVIGLGMINHIDDKAVIRLAFRAFDLDHDEHIHIHDLKKILTRAYQDLSQDEIDNLLSCLHTQEHGKVNYEQFEEFAQGNELFVQTFRQTFKK